MLNKNGGGPGGFGVGGFAQQHNYMYNMYNAAAAVAAGALIGGPSGQASYHSTGPHHSSMSSLGLSSAAAAAGAPMGLGGGFCTVGA